MASRQPTWPGTTARVTEASHLPFQERATPVLNSCRRHTHRFELHQPFVRRNVPPQCRGSQWGRSRRLRRGWRRNGRVTGGRASRREMAAGARPSCIGKGVAGSGYRSANATTQVLGAAGEVAAIEVAWPSGKKRGSQLSRGSRKWWLLNCRIPKASTWVLAGPVYFCPLMLQRFFL